ncbi:MAG: shikimate dehydrogenase family protein [Limnohabitans sp.]
MINGHTEIIAHIGYPTHSFKAPMIYNPFFEEKGINAIVVPMGCRTQEFSAFLPLVFRLSNIRGALITMPHKVSVVSLLDEVTPAVQVAGACNAVRLSPQGRLQGDMFDGEGFVRGLQNKGLVLRGCRALVVGAGGVGRAITASLAASGVGSLSLFDVDNASAQGLADRVREHYPTVQVQTGARDPAGHDLVVNATPLGMNEGDPLPFDVRRLSPDTFVGEVVMKRETTPLLAAAQALGCRVQVGTDMLYEQIPAYLEFFGLPTTTAAELRRLSQVSYT